MIKIQKEDFNLEDEINLIKSQYLNIGAVSTFVGYVRNLNNKQKEAVVQNNIRDLDLILTLLSIFQNLYN